jgi:hypothetical protein
MKKLLILVIAMAMTWASYAQTASLEETGDKPHVMAEHIFGLLDKTPITTKRLWDKAIDFLPMDDYNGRYPARAGYSFYNALIVKKLLQKRLILERISLYGMSHTDYLSTAPFTNKVNY